MATFSYGIQKQYFPVADTDFRIATFGFQDADPGHWYRAIKQEHVLQYVVAGRGRFEVNGKTYAVAAGDLSRTGSGERRRRLVRHHPRRTGGPRSEARS